MLNFQDPLTAESNPATAKPALSAAKGAGQYAGQYNDATVTLTSGYGASAKTPSAKAAIDFESVLSATSETSRTSDTVINVNTDHKAGKTSAASNIPANSERAANTIIEQDSIKNANMQNAKTVLSFVNFESPHSGPRQIKPDDVLRGTEGQETARVKIAPTELAPASAQQSVKVTPVTSTVLKTETVGALDLMPQDSTPTLLPAGHGDAPPIQMTLGNTQTTTDRRLNNQNTAETKPVEASTLKTTTPVNSEGAASRHQAHLLKMTDPAIPTQAASDAPSPVISSPVNNLPQFDALANNVFEDNSLEINTHEIQTLVVQKSQIEPSETDTHENNLALFSKDQQTGVHSSPETLAMHRLEIKTPLGIDAPEIEAQDIERTAVQTAHAEISMDINNIDAPSQTIMPLAAPPQTTMPLAARPAVNSDAAIERAEADHTIKIKDQIENQLQSQQAERKNLNTSDLDALDVKAREVAAPLDAAARLESAQSFALTPLAPTAAPAAPAAISIAAPLQTPLDKPAVTALAQTLVKTLETQKGVSVRLDPPEMGRVYIDYQFDRDNTVTALLRADTPEILAQLRDNSAALQDFLKQSGFDSITLNFEQSGLDSGAYQEGAHQEDHQSDKGYKDSAITIGGKQETLTAAQAAQTILGRSQGLAAASIDIKL